jgi:sec-independent protein translocase protein TatC
VETLRSKRRISWFVMALFAALITPTPDAITMMMLWLPMSLLFELGLFLVARMAVGNDFDDTPDQEEFVGA